MCSGPGRIATACCSRCAHQAAPRCTPRRTTAGSAAGAGSHRRGMPIIVAGQVAGAIGVAGAITGAEDERIAEVAVASLDS
jgi:uncharacterized protein GlcG (DUF336 family)